MKTLLVLRHAKSSWADPDLADVDRPLKKRGRAEAPRIGRFLRERDLVPDAILVSPARRALRTAELVAEAAGVDGEIVVVDALYPGDPQDCLAALHAVADACERVLLVGHNPGLEDLVEALTGRAVRLTTATLAHVELPVGRWADLDEPDDGALVGVVAARDLPE